MPAASPHDVRPAPAEPPYQPLVVVLTAVAAGILCDRFWPLPLWAWWTMALGGLAAWLAPLLVRRWLQLGEMPRLLFSNAAMLLAVAATTAAWHHCRWYLRAEDDLGRYALRKAQPICVEATAVRMPRVLPTPPFDPMRMMPPTEGSRLEVDVAAVRDGSQWRRASGRATLLVQGPPPQVRAGDRLRCFARLSAPLGPQNPGAFDRAAHLRADGIYSQLLAEVPQCLSVVQPGGWLNFTALLDRVRTHSNRLLEDSLDPGCAQMAEVVLLGEREQVDFGRTENFMATGTIHLLVISGLHLSILAGALFWIVRRTPLPQGWATVLVAVATVFYMFLVDAGPPVVRATVLVLVTCAAAARGRSPLSFNSLAGAALVVLAMNPGHLFHAGAQLSFLSVAGLMWFAPRWVGAASRKDPLERLIAENRGWAARAGWAFARGACHLLLISAMLSLLTMPLVMARFHLCTPVAVLVNSVVWMPMAWGLISGAVLLVIGTLAPPLAHVCGYCCNLNFSFMEWLVVMARQIPGGNFWVPGPADWWLWGFYGGLGLLAAFPLLRPPRRWCSALLAGWIAVGFAAAWPRHHDRLDCTFLSMGHGCAVLLELPSGQTMLYDAGQFGAPSAGTRAISESLWSRGITHLDAVVLSHPDIDHYNALPGLLERFSVGAVYVSPIMFDRESHAVTALRSAIDAWGVPIRELRAGDRLRGGDGCLLEVLHPPRRGALGSDNANSLVLSVAYQGRRILLPGDLEAPGLNDVLAEEPRPCDVLMAPHHGSRQSNPPGLATWCRPRWVVFSGDGRWNLPEVEAPYRKLGGQTLHTFESGAIEVRIDAAGVRVSEFVERERWGDKVRR